MSNPQTPDELDAESRKYSSEVIILLRLRSGNFAVFNAARELQRIVPTITEEALAVTAPPGEPDDLLQLLGLI